MSTKKTTKSPAKQSPAKVLTSHKEISDLLEPLDKRELAQSGAQASAKITPYLRSQDMGISELTAVLIQIGLDPKDFKEFSQDKERLLKFTKGAVANYKKQREENLFRLDYKKFGYLGLSSEIIYVVVNYNPQVTVASKHTEGFLTGINGKTYYVSVGGTSQLPLQVIESLSRLRAPIVPDSRKVSNLIRHVRAQDSELSEISSNIIRNSMQKTMPVFNIAIQPKPNDDVTVTEANLARIMAGR